MQQVRRSGVVTWIVVVLVVAAVSVALTLVAVQSSGSTARTSAAGTSPAAAPSASAAVERHATTSTLGIPPGERPEANEPSSVDLATTWTPPADLPQQGRLLRVAVPGTTSHFAARDALLWLPPAALVADPPPLPVAVLMAGQSRGAGPDDLETAGHIAQTMDAIASLHRGLAPIVVVPDQLGPQSGNPMCIDGPLGNSSTYLEHDVPAWITSHLRVQTGAAAWTIGGFSQGGTCAIQLGAGDPARYGNIVDVSGELGPSLGNEARTIALGFSGNAAAYRAAQPLAIMARHGRYPATWAFFTAAALDRKYGPAMPVVAGRAAAVGMHVTTWVLPGSRHDWAMASEAIAAGMSWLEPHVGLAASD
ncbi:alpha/beta hydrolase [Curtobacterium oceanosedimentum]|uniref:alpha/beta hydrolase n=1 Tax=Curtobacterium oceanosedimentum TaxID=465820 RepID=UPI00128F9ACE|nr:alpha/beta hydrolase-fold protein [Curtobacterium oceanosedimentum]